MTEQYQFIKMCEKAKLPWEPKVGDWTDKGLVVEVGMRNVLIWIRGYTEPFKKKELIFCPTQWQLQEMVFTEDHGLQTQCYRIYQFSLSEAGHGHTIDGSQRQLWLAFVMHELYQKKWTGEDWE